MKLNNVIENLIKEHLTDEIKLKLIGYNFEPYDVFVSDITEHDNKILFIVTDLNQTEHMVYLNELERFEKEALIKFIFFLLNKKLYL